ncbi:hypothetical protein ASG75_09530 [Rhodanobacter sp. Soil772]|uniref:PIN domain-containing protein n=1 Tax=Rhodanobacter sp. Soil772 TaxID=1736406 RepID=UPI0006F57C08|nr:PIN domain-containing protein [Rhodanobacter sp. Soil772]KRE85789.1 hypothetical protein ASG75_09530 [Rhodanobacter sp. Soil772]
MSPHFVLVDFENVQPESLGPLKPGTCRIYIFLGQQQSKISLELTKALQPFGDDVRYIQIVGNGPNALDFHISFYVGQLAALHPDARFTIVSKDGGFDPLIKHITTLKMACRRVKSLDGAAKTTPTAAAPVTPAKKATSKLVISFTPPHDASSAKSQGVAQVATPPKPSPKIDPVQQRVDETLARLAGMKKSKPASLKTLRSSIASWFTPKLAGTTLEAVINRLTQKGHIKLTGNKVSYALKPAEKK